MSPAAKPGTARQPQPVLELDSEVNWLKGAGPAIASRLAAAGIHVVRDLLFHLPLRYEDRSASLPFAALQLGMPALVVGRVEAADVQFGRRRSLRVAIGDESGRGLVLRFFHFNEGQRAAFAVGRSVRAFGIVRSGHVGFELVHPDYRVADSLGSLGEGDGVLPVYPAAGEVSQSRLRALIGLALTVAAADPSLRAPLPGVEGPDTYSALLALHRPQDTSALAALSDPRHPAKKRLIREELLAHQLAMRRSRRRAREVAGPMFGSLDAARDELQAILPFTLSRAQSRVLAEIGADLTLASPMLRLVQGDVGSGKTAVAAVALLAAVRSGWQGALMAPTALLAEQHAMTLSRWFAPLGINVVLLTGRAARALRAPALAAIADGSAKIAVGTHALFQQEVAFHRLGLVVVDEQHRFGVGQRLALRNKSQSMIVPHQLVLSATPIPRTLAQTLYADLDVSQIDELPPGRTPVQTVALAQTRRDDVLRRIGEVCAAGRRAYWVCTLVEESEELDAQAAEATFAQLREELPLLRVGLIHGRMKSSEKEAVMRAFKDGDLQLLVATTVIEVGVDVPEASIMIIDDAQRLGLSQLHQLRGRVGRGSTASQCVLLYRPPLSTNARARLETLRTTEDGFKIAERDLELRGPGELLGRRQTGVVGLRIADPLRDADLIPDQRALAERWLDHHPEQTLLLIKRWIGDASRFADV